MSEYIEIIDHIMWQPTSSCSLSCPGCYVQKQEQATANIEVVRKVYAERSIMCSQFTVSLDNLRSYPHGLLGTIKGIWKRYPDAALPELCVTANSWNTIQCWARDLDMSIDDFLKPITILSLSTFPPLGKNISEVVDKCHSLDTRVNFNHLVKGGEEDSKPFEMGCRYADQVYLVFKKAPLGEPQCAESFSNWLKARKIVQDTARDKLIEDQCIMDSIHHRHTGHECGAGKKKAQVWPDGRMTGCPYDSNHTCNGIESCKISEVIGGLN